MNISSTSVGKIGEISPSKVQTVKPAEEVQSSAADRLDVSSGARDAAAALNALKALPDVREDKVAEAAAKLDQGTLETSGDALAGRLLEHLEGSKE